MMILNRQVNAPRGTTLSCKGWQQEAARRMLMNNLDPEVAGRPDELITSCGATWVSVHHAGGAGIGCSIRAGMVVVADGTREADETLERVLTCDAGVGVARRADAGYPEAIATAARAHIDMPMGTPGGVVR